MLRAVTWRMYAVAALILGTDLGLGLAYHSNGNVETWASRIGWVSLVFSPLVVVAAYTVTQQKWWRNTLGTALIWLCIAYLPVAIPLAWVFAFDNGQLTSSWLGWFFVSGAAFSSLVLLLLASIFVRIGKDRKNGNEARNTGHDGDA